MKSLISTFFILCVATTSFASDLSTHTCNAIVMVKGQMFDTKPFAISMSEELKKESQILNVPTSNADISLEIELGFVPGDAQVPVEGVQLKASVWEYASIAKIFMHGRVTTQVAGFNPQIISASFGPDNVDTFASVLCMKK